MKMIRTQTFRPIRVNLLIMSLLTIVNALYLGAQAPPKGSIYEPDVPAESNDYAMGSDSQPQVNVPKGTIFRFELDDSKIFPDTSRTITVYTPAEYTPQKPACLYLGLDDLIANAPTVFDNLIAQHAMPVTIGIGVAPGTVKPASGDENPRFDRSFEFDSRDDSLARFILEEVIPAVVRHKTPQGDPILISTDPNDHAIGGGSTGAPVPRKNSNCDHERRFLTVKTDRSIG